MDKNLEYEQMNAQTTGNIHISFSEFSLFNGCGHRHLIEKYLKLETQPPSIHLFFGNAIHEAIELSIKNSWGTEKKIEHFTVTFRKEMMNNMSDTPDFKDLNPFLEQGSNILRILSIPEILEEYEIISVEEALYEKVYGKYYFKGFIDLVLRNRKTGRYLIVDWKTSGQAWVMKWKLSDYIFLCQMRFYKYFWARKNNIKLSEIDCRYVVLNRLKNKKKADSGFGEIQNVDVNSSEGEIKDSLEKLATTIQMIQLKKSFP